MKTVYLKNGQQANLIEKIGNKFIVQRIMTYENYDYEGSAYPCEVEGNEEVVNEIFDNPPKDKIDSQILELEAKKKIIESEIQELNTEKRKLSFEISQLGTTKINSEKFIINRSDILNAKTLALFPKNRILPILHDKEKKSLRGLKVTLSVEISTGKQNAWGYQLYEDYNSSSDYLCEKYGILINPTQEEIDEVIIKRLSEFEFDSRQIASVDDKYLSEKLLTIKSTYLEDKKAKDKAQKESQIEKLKQELLKLQQQ